MATGTGTRDLAKTRARGAEYFAGRQTRAGLVARRLLGTSTPKDAELADHLARESRRQTRMDGSVDGSLVKSAWSLLELVQLDCPPDHSAVVRVGGWLMGRQNQPGRFGEGCDDSRHAAGTCQHFVTGFFSPAGSEDAVAPLGFPNGVVIHDELEARFAVSCFALRAVLKARQERRQAALDHVSSLLNLGDVWSGWGAPWSPDLVLFALGAVAPAPLDFRDRVEGIAGRLARLQKKDGEWPGADLLHAVDTFLAIPSAPAQAAVRAALPGVAALGDEVFSDSGNEERALIAVRALAAA